MHQVTPSTAARAAVKVPEITVLFWVLKVLTTGMGEAASDWPAGINLVLAGGLGVVCFAVALWFQFRTTRYVAPVYWATVAGVALFGTMAADVVHVAGLPYPVTTSGYLILLALVFWRWHRTEGTLSIHSIDTRRREVYYWVTVLVTFALGTAAGDLVASTLHLGFLAAGVLFAVLMLVPLIGLRAGMPAVATFWTAYVLTRPLGASFADWFGKPPSFGRGLGYGDGTVTGVMFVAFVVLVAVATYLDRVRAGVTQDVVADVARAT